MKKLAIIIPYFGVMLGMTLFMAAAHATTYTPESGMNNRYGAIVANFKNSTLDDTVQADSDKLDRIRDRVCAHFLQACQAIAADPDNITNSEKSKFYIQKLKDVWQTWLKDRGITEYEETYAGGIEAAGDSAAADAN
jgi:arginyl-tRNA--protein-N-Asp/Glu arginylyltransferase